MVDSAGIEDRCDGVALPGDSRAGGYLELAPENILEGEGERALLERIATEHRASVGSVVGEPEVALAAPAELVAGAGVNDDTGKNIRGRVDKEVQLEVE